MFPKKSSILFNQVNPGDTGGGGANAQTTPQVPPPTPSTPTPQAQGGIEYDELGYAIPKAQQPPAPNQTPKTPEPAAATPPAAEVNSGYNTPPPPPNAAGYVDPNAAPPAPAAAATPPATPPAPAPGEFKLEVDLKDFNDADKKLFTENFEKYKLPKDAQQALVDIRKTYLTQQATEQANHQKQIETQVNELKTSWFNELKNDKDFGGANFDANTKMVNKFINDFMPNTKKMLTEKGGMLPPNTTRDFHAVAKKLYETEGFVQGDGSAASETKPTDQWKFLSDMYVNN